MRVNLFFSLNAFDRGGENASVLMDANPIFIELLHYCNVACSKSLRGTIWDCSITVLSSFPTLSHLWWIDWAENRDHTLILFPWLQRTVNDAIDRRGSNRGAIDGCVCWRGCQKRVRHRKSDVVLDGDCPLRLWLPFHSDHIEKIYISLALYQAYT